MASKRPAHRKGTTGDAYRRAQVNQFRRSNICARCGHPTQHIKCNPQQHPKHAHLPYCPTHPLAPSLGHKQDLQDGGSVLDPRNHQTEHYGCNARAGVTARMAKQRATKTSTTTAHRDSWNW